MHEFYKNIEEYNPGKENKALIVFDDMTANMISNQKFNSIVTELFIKNLNSVVTKLFIRGRKLNSSLVFMTQSYFKVPKVVRLNATQYFITKTSNKKELQQLQ